MKPTSCTNFSNVFWNDTLRVSDSSSVHHQESVTVHTAMVYVIPLMLTAWERDQDGTAVPFWSCSKAVYKHVWHIPLLCVQWRTPHDGQRNCPKHTEFHSKNKFEKSVHLVDFIIRICHDAQSHERKMYKMHWDAFSKDKYIASDHSNQAYVKNKILNQTWT